MTENLNGMDEKMLARVRALLAKAESTQYPEEAHAFSRKAEELIASYGIERALLDAEQGEDNRPGVVSRFVNIHPPYSIDGKLMFFGLAAAMNCKAVSLGKYGKVRRMHLFGYESDVERFMIMWNSLRNQALNLLTYVEGNFIENAKTARCNFYAGFRHVVVERVAQVERGAADEAVPGAALVLADRSALVQAETAKTYPQLTVSRSAPKRSATGSYYAGREAGSRATLGNATLTRA